MSCNIFFSDDFEGNSILKLTFKPDHLLTSSLQEKKILSSGSLVIAKKYVAPYTVLDIGKPLTIIRVDFRHATKKESKIIFRQLREFIVSQDASVIVFGEFGLPAWVSDFKRFLSKTDLQVKNRLLFTESKPFNIFTIPSFYILGFKDMGVRNIEIDKSSTEESISFDVSFNSAQP